MVVVRLALEMAAYPRPHAMGNVVSGSDAELFPASAYTQSSIGLSPALAACYLATNRLGST
jgi:hypothetical protein